MSVKSAPLKALEEASSRDDVSPDPSLPNSIRVGDKQKSIRRLEPMASSSSTVGTASVAGGGGELTAQNLLQRDSISGIHEDNLQGNHTPSKDHHYTHNKPFLSKEGSAVFGKMSRQGSKVGSVYSSDNEGDKSKEGKLGSRKERKMTNSSAGGAGTGIGLGGAKVAITDEKMEDKSKEEDEKADIPPLIVGDKEEKEKEEEEEGSPYVMYVAYGISIAMGVAALVLYFMWKHTGGLTNGMSLLILILTIPSVCLSSLSR